MLKIDLLKRKKQLEEYISRIEPWLKTQPSLNMKVSTICKKEKNYFRYYCIEKGVQHSIKKDPKLIERLAKKDYYSKVLLAAKKELKHVDSLLEAVDGIRNVCTSMHKAKIKLLSPLEKPVEELIKSFLEEKYPPSEYEIKNPNNTLKGDIVRSWQEASIANTLFNAEVPYRYEKPFTLYNGYTIRPDFTIMHPVSGEIFIWEHFGMMDNENYKENFIRKIKDYTLSDMVIGKNLIATFDDDGYKMTEIEFKTIVSALFK